MMVGLGDNDMSGCLGGVKGVILADERLGRIFTGSAFSSLWILSCFFKS
jgi:hypothetical protein